MNLALGVVDAFCVFQVSCFSWTLVLSLAGIIFRMCQIGIYSYELNMIVSHYTQAWTRVLLWAPHASSTLSCYSQTNAWTCPPKVQISMVCIIIQNRPFPECDLDVQTHVMSIQKSCTNADGPQLGDGQFSANVLLLCQENYYSQCLDFDVWDRKV